MSPNTHRSHLLSLLQRAREEQDPAARHELNTILRTHPEIRRIMTDLLLEEHALCTVLQEKEITGLIHPEKAPRPRNAFHSRHQTPPWRLLASAAAGLVAGLFGATLVYGFSRQPEIHSRTLLDEPFEDPQLPLERGLPNKTGVWSGDLKMPGSGSDISPANGSGMVVLPPVEKRKYSYAMRFVDLSSWSAPKRGTIPKIEVSASFTGSGPGNRYQIRLAAFGGTVAEARAIWLENHVDEQALAHAARTVAATEDPGVWNRLTASLDVPQNTQLVLVSLAASTPPDSPAGKQAAALDDVQIRLISQELPP